jgi:hypothetical protein
MQREATNYIAHPQPYDALEMNCGWSVQGTFACDDDAEPLCKNREQFTESIAQPYVQPIAQDTQTPYVFYDPYFSEPAWIPSEATVDAIACKENK